VETLPDLFVTWLFVTAQQDIESFVPVVVCQSYKKMAPQLVMIDLATRRKICEDTIARSQEITSSTTGASLNSTFVTISSYLELSTSSLGFPDLKLRSPIEVLDSDTFAAARSILVSNLTSLGKIAVLNLASDAEPAGGWRYTLSTTQEEALCYSSTLYATLKPEYYPWPNTGEGSVAGIYSPAVVVFKDTISNDCCDLKPAERMIVGVVTVAAPCLPKLTDDRLEFADESVLKEFRDKVRLVLRIMAADGKTCIVLGAMGCGAYRCPPGLVAREMKGVLEEEEFQGWFELIVFAVYGSGPVGKRNLEIFRNAFGHEE